MDADLALALSNESQRVEEDALYSSRGHFEAAARWSRAHYMIGIPTAILAAIAGGSAVTERVVFAASIGFLVTALSALNVFLNPSDRSHQHHTAGTRFSEVRTKARIFREVDLRGTKDSSALADELKALAALRDELNKASPQIPRWAFGRARKSIAAGETTYEVDQHRAGGK